MSHLGFSCLMCLWYCLLILGWSTHLFHEFDNSGTIRWYSWWSSWSCWHVASDSIVGFGWWWWQFDVFLVWGTPRSDDEWSTRTIIRILKVLNWNLATWACRLSMGISAYISSSLKIFSSLNYSLQFIHILIMLSIIILFHTLALFNHVLICNWVNCFIFIF